MVPAAGVEPATFRSGGGRSNPLSYAGNVFEEKIAQLIDARHYPLEINIFHWQNSADR